MTRWFGLAEFVSSMRYWSEVQQALQASGYFRGATPLFGSPYLDEDRVIVPRGPGHAEDSDGYTDYSILDEGDLFSIRTSGRSRGRFFENTTRWWFGTFDDAAKYFVARDVAHPIRLRHRDRGLEVINWRWLDRGLAPMWSEVAVTDPNGFEHAKKFFRTDDPTRFYMTVSNDTATSHLLNLSWPDLNATYSGDIPGLERFELPRFPR